MKVSRNGQVSIPADARARWNADRVVVVDLAQLRRAVAEPVDVAWATRAGLLRPRHYNRSKCSVSLADCVAAEAARGAGSALASGDPHLLDVCHRETIAVVVLPDSQGH